MIPVNNKKTCSELLKQWQHGTRIFHIGHQIAASKTEATGRKLGIGVAVTSAIVSSSIFLTVVKKFEGEYIGYFSALFSLLPVALASISNYVKYPELAEKHRTAAATYGDLRKEIETIIYCHKKECENCSHRCDEILKIQRMWSAAESKHLAVPEEIYKKAVNQANIDEENKGEKQEGCPRHRT